MRNSSCKPERVEFKNFRSTEQATILHRRPGEAYVHYVDMDKRMDEWVPEDACRLLETSAPLPPPPPVTETKKRRGGRPRTRRLEEEAEASTSNTPNGAPAPLLPDPDYEMQTQDDAELTAGPAQAPMEVVMTEEEFDLRHHQQLNAQKNFDMVVFDTWKIKPWYVYLLPSRRPSVNASCPIQVFFALSIDGV